MKKAIVLAFMFFTAFTAQAYAQSDGMDFRMVIKESTEKIELLEKEKEKAAAAANGFLAEGRQEESLKEFSKVSEIDLTLARLYNDRGFSLFSTGNYKESVSDYDKVLQQNENNAGALGFKGMALVRLGKYDEGLAYLDKAIVLSPDTGDLYIFKATALQKKGMDKEALKALDKAISIDPKSKEAYSYKAALLYETNKNKGLQIIKKSLPLKSDQAFSYYLSGIVCVSYGLLEDAMKEFDNALNYSPYNPTYHTAKIETLMLLKYYNQALLAADKLISMNIMPKADVHMIKAKIYGEMGQPMNELAECDKAISYDARSIKAYERIFAVLSENMKEEELVAEYDKLIKSHPEVPLLHIKKIEALNDMCSFDEALKESNQFIKKYPDIKEIYLYRAAALTGAGKNKEALKDLDYVADLKTLQTDNYYYLRAVVLEAMGDKEAALEELNRSLEENRLYGKAEKAKVRLMAELGKNDELLAEYDKMIAKDPSDKETYYKKAELLSSLRRNKEAMDEIEKAIKLDPENKDAYIKKTLLAVEIKDHKKFTDSIAKLIKIDDENKYIYLSMKGLQEILFLNPEKGLKDSEKVIKLFPQEPAGYFVKAFALGFMEKYKEAEACIDKAEELLNAQEAGASFVEKTALYSLRAAINLEYGEYDLAFENNRKAAEAMASSEDMSYYAIIYSLNANVYADLKEYDKAFESIAKAEKSSPEETGYYIRARIYTELGEYDKAVEDCMRELGLRASSEDFVYYYLAQAYIYKGELDKALGALEKSTEKSYRPFVYSDDYDKWMEILGQSKDENAKKIIKHIDSKRRIRDRVLKR